MIGLSEKGPGTFRGPLLPLAYIRPNDRYPILACTLVEIATGMGFDGARAGPYRRRVDHPVCSPLMDYLDRHVR
jgi:hypothetical protein